MKLIVNQFQLLIDTGYLDKERINLGVVGSRSFHNKEFAHETLDGLRWLLGDFTVVSGGADGADKIAEDWARDRHLDLILYPADWAQISLPDALVRTRKNGTQYDARAGFRRNQMIVDRSDLLVAFWDGASPGTRDTIDRAMTAQKIVLEYWPGKEPEIIPPF